MKSYLKILFILKELIKKGKHMLISVILLLVFAIIAYWVITTFFPEPIRMVCLVVVGVICLFWLFNILAVAGVTGPIPSKLIN